MQHNNNEMKASQNKKLQKRQK